MTRGNESSSWFWVTLVRSCITIVALVFATCELVEHRAAHRYSGGR